MTPLDVVLVGLDPLFHAGRVGSSLEEGVAHKGLAALIGPSALVLGLLSLTLLAILFHLLQFRV